MVRVKRSILPDACVWNWRTARAHDRENRYDCGARKCARKRATAIPLRRHERDEFFQYQSCNARTRGLSARLERTRENFSEAQARDRARSTLFLERVRRTCGESRG